MEADHIEREILIEAPVDVVWSVLTEPEQMARWFSDAAEVDLRHGGQGVLTFNQRATNQTVVVPIQIESVDPPHTFSYRWGHPAGTEARAGNSALVEFRLTPEGTTTRLRLVESGLLEMDWSDEARTSYAEDHGKGWDMHMASLRNYVSQQALAKR